MRALAPIINENLVDLWEKVIPKLITYLNGIELIYIMPQTCPLLSWYIKISTI